MDTCFFHEITKINKTGHFCITLYTGQYTRFWFSAYRRATKAQTGANKQMLKDARAFAASIHKIG